MTGQHPYLAVLDPRISNALLVSVRLSHVLPHNVRVNPLCVNTAKIIKVVKMQRNREES